MQSHTFCYLEPFPNARHYVVRLTPTVVEMENANASLGPLGPMVVMFYCWGSQHSNNGLGLAVAHMALNDFMAGFLPSRLGKPYTIQLGSLPLPRRSTQE
eukprot:COSAG02_NODE_380_length_23483_cov_8.034382_13_plen_100_part_00